jgi:hypothetical protein
MSKVIERTFYGTATGDGITYEIPVFGLSELAFIKSYMKHTLISGKGKHVRVGYNGAHILNSKTLEIIFIFKLKEDC